MKQIDSDCGQDPNGEQTQRNSKQKEDEAVRPEGCFARWGKTLLVCFLIALCINIMKSCKQQAQWEQQRIEDEQRRQKSMEALKSLYSTMPAPRSGSRLSGVTSSD